MDKVSMTQTQATNIIKTLYDIMRSIHKLNSPRLGAECKDFVKRACLAMNDSVHNKIERGEKDGEYVALAEIIKEEEKEWARQAAMYTEADLSTENRIHKK